MTTIAAIGEVLIDKFENKKIIGGAPFNFIHHLTMLSKVSKNDVSSILISTIGDDIDGKLIEQHFRKFELNSSGIQKDKFHPTGIVDVSLKSDGSAIYNIIENSSWDFIQPIFPKTTIDILYFGTLFLRSEHNRHTFQKILKNKNHIKTFFDINLRQHYFSKDTIIKCLENCNYLKINHEETEFICASILNINSKDFEKYIFEHYSVELIILTKAEKGAELILKNGMRYTGQGKNVVNLKNTVGAGDAFSAIFCFGTTLNWTNDKILERAIEFSAKICEEDGAIPNTIEWYHQFEKWF